MVKLVLEIGLPILLLPMVLGVGRIVLELRRPIARALGCILSELCVVSYDEVRRYCELMDQQERFSGPLWREIRRKQVFVIGQYVREMMLNTRLFQQAVSFEQKKIDPRKSSFEYERRETLIACLVEESSALRWQLYKCQMNLTFRAILKLNANYEPLVHLLDLYKTLEEDMIHLAAMFEDGYYREMLQERLGLKGWRIVDGGASEPEPA